MSELCFAKVATDKLGRPVGIVFGARLEKVMAWEQGPVGVSVDTSTGIVQFVRDGEQEGATFQWRTKGKRGRSVINLAAWLRELNDIRQISVNALYVMLYPEESRVEFHAWRELTDSEYAYVVSRSRLRTRTTSRPVSAQRKYYRSSNEEVLQSLALATRALGAVPSTKQLRNRTHQLVRQLPTHETFAARFGSWPQTLKRLEPYLEAVQHLTPGEAATRFWATKGGDLRSVTVHLPSEVIGAVIARVGDEGVGQEFRRLIAESYAKELVVEATPVRQQYKNPTGYTGVHPQRGKFSAQIRKGYLGTFDSAEVAATAFDLAALKTQGALARLNNPECQPTYKLILAVLENPRFLEMWPRLTP